LSGVVLENLSKRFGDVQALRDLTLEIEDGEFFSLLGPSGCGKTTTLRLIAGFEEPTTGRILLGGTDVTNRPPNRRPVNTVFQHYALFPHLSIQDNISFGLGFTDLTKQEKKRRVGEALSLVRLEGFERRKPNQLSGGEQQRVALARALVLNPRVLLLDEPLGALDAKLRRALQIELKTIQQQVGITFVYVTHDQEEALTMSDRILVMAHGRPQQIGTAEELYEEPNNAFVADFLGISNLMPAEAHGRGIVSLGEHTVRAGRGLLDETGPVTLTIRPERIRLEALGPETENRLRGVVTRLVYLGSTSQALIELPHGDVVQVLLTVDGTMPLREGMILLVHLPTESLRILAAPRTEPTANGGSRGTNAT
jgi:spermidine/putrescine transport system ATP-binding protein